MHSSRVAINTFASPSCASPISTKRKWVQQPRFVCKFHCLLHYPAQNLRLFDKHFRGEDWLENTSMNWHVNVTLDLFWCVSADFSSDILFWYLAPILLIFHDSSDNLYPQFSSSESRLSQNFVQLAFPRPPSPPPTEILPQLWNCHLFSSALEGSSSSLYLASAYRSHDSGSNSFHLRIMNPQVSICISKSTIQIVF